MNENEQELKSLQRDAADVTGGEILSLNADIFELFYNLTAAPQQFPTESEICHAISLVLLRYWHLCSITTFLVDDAGRLQESAIHIDEHSAQSHTRLASAELAAHVKLQNRECEIWLDTTDERAALEDSCPSHVCDVPDEIRQRVAATKLKGAFGVPIHRRGNLVGVLVAFSNVSADLREARRGMRFIALPIVIALAEARRAAAVREGREHIAELNRELQQNNHALEEANRELQRVARYRSLFLSRMSHELRTPLTSILGFTEILLDHEALTEPQRRFCEKIQASGLQQQESLNALVDLSRLEAGQSELFLHEFSLREMLRESCAAVNRLARKGEVTLERTVDENLCTIVSDEGKLRQVLYNFLAFAIHRTPPGGRVRIEARGANGNANFKSPAQRLRIEIVDEGETLADPAHIFEPTDTGHAPGAMPNDRGTNMDELGLAISHRLIGVLQGTVELQSEGEQGLRVRLTFPQIPPAEVLV